MASNLPPPVCLAFILCHYVHVDPSTGKHSIHGTFPEFGFDRLPTKLPCPSNLFEPIEGCGSTPIRIKLINVNEGRPAIFDVTEVMDLLSPKIVVKHAESIQGMPFDQPGECRVRLFAGEHFLPDRILIVVGVEG